MKIYYIDSENTHNFWIPLLDEKDAKFIIFYTENSNYMSYSMVDQINRSKSNIEFIKCEPGEKGENGLDLQLTTYISFQAHIDNCHKYFIVADDKGYDATISYLQSKEVNVTKLTTSEIVKETSPSNSVPKCEAKSDNQSTLPKEQKNSINLSTESELYSNTDTLLDQTNEE